MSTNGLSELRDRIVQALRSDPDQKVRPARNGGLEFRCPTPSHDDSRPSAWMGTRGWKCMGCGAGGGFRHLAELLGLDVPGSGYTVSDYADDKTFSAAVLREWGLTDAQDNKGQPVVRIPYYDEQGHELRARFRSRTGKWWEGHDLPIYLYGRDRLVDAAQGDAVLVVEGESDCHALWSAGLLAVGVPGATCWKKEWAQYLKGLEVYVWEEPDQGGPQLVRSLAADFPEIGVIRTEEAKDACELYQSLGERFAERVRELMDEAVPVEARQLEDSSRTVEAGTDAPTLTDSGNATRLVRLHGQRLRHIAKWDKWVTCGGDGFWMIDHKDVRIRELAKDVGHQLKREAADEPDEKRARGIFAFGLNSLNSYKIGGMVDLARGIEGIPLDHEDLDRDGWLLGVENGVIDLRTGRLRPADPADLMTRQAAVTWDEDAEAPRFDQARAEWHSDAGVRAYVQRVAGSALVGGQRDHVFIVNYGHGRNGKGTLSRALHHVLGPYAMVIHLSLLVQSKFSEHDTVKAQLFRTRLAIASETQRRIKLDEASVKNLTGGNRITARRMREDSWEFDPTHSLWLETNHLPEISGRDTGIWSRIRVVKWESTFEGKDQDQDLDDTLAAEAPGILRWLVEGCLEWQREGLAEPESVIRDTLEYRAAEDTFARFQADMAITFAPNLEILAAELQDLLSEWASADGIRPPSQELGDWLKDHGARQARQRYQDHDGKRRQRRVWLGVGINDGNHESEQTDVLA